MKKITLLTLAIICSFVAVGFGQATKKAEKATSTAPATKKDDLLPAKPGTKDKPANDKIKRLDDADELLPAKPGTKDKPANDKIKRLGDGNELLPAKPGRKENPANDKIKRLDDGDELLPAKPGTKDKPANDKIKRLDDADELLPAKPGTKENPANDKIKRLDDADGLLPAKPNTKENPANDKIKRLDDADDLLPIDVKKGLNEPKESDLLDISVKTQRPSQPNAGQRVYDEIPLNGNFTFNKKISFAVKSPEGNLNSYFYFNTQTGYSMLDDQANEQFVAKSEGTMTQIKTPQSNFYGYSKTSEGNFAFEIGTNNNGPAFDQLKTEVESERFFSTFKKSPNVVSKGTNGVPFTRVGYTGKDDEGNRITIWLSDPQDVKIDIGYTYAISGYWALGYIASPTGRTYMITGIEGDGMSIFLTSIQNTTMQFSGAGYKTMDEMMAQSIQQNEEEAAENPTEDPSIDEEDAALRGLMKQGYELQKKVEGRLAAELKKATTSGNISAITDMTRPTIQSLEEQQQLMEINSKIEYRRSEINLKNASGNKEQADYRNAMSCNLKQRNHWNQYYDLAKELVKKNPTLETYDLTEKIGSLMGNYVNKSMKLCQ